jgi:hypothetical protein
MVPLAVRRRWQTAKALTVPRTVAGNIRNTRWWARQTLEQRRAELKERTDRIRPWFPLLSIIGGHHRMGTKPPIIGRYVDGTFVPFEGTWPEIWAQIKALSYEANPEKLPDAE